MNALSAVRFPAVALDRFGFVLEATSSAEALFDNEILVSDKRLVLRDKEARTVFDRFLAQLRNTPDVDVLEVDPIVVRREARRPIVIRVMPIPGAARTPFLGARALLAFKDLEAEQTPQANILVQAFKLTQAEARLAYKIGQGLSPEAAAKQLGICRETARGQLKAIFAKTDTHRQSELVLLLSRFTA